MKKKKKIKTKPIKSMARKLLRQWARRIVREDIKDAFHGITGLHF